MARLNGLLPALWFIFTPSCAPPPSTEESVISQGTAQLDSLPESRQAGPDSNDALQARVLGPPRVAKGAATRFQVVLVNDGTAPLNLVQGTGPALSYDLIVAGPAGKVVWERIPPGEGMATVALHSSLAPGTQRELETVVWDQRDMKRRPVEPGRYLVYGVFFGGVEGTHIYETPTDTTWLRIEDK